MINDAAPSAESLAAINVCGYILMIYYKYSNFAIGAGTNGYSSA